MGRYGRHRTESTWGAYSTLDEVLRGAELVRSDAHTAAGSYLLRGLGGFALILLVWVAHWSLQDSWSLQGSDGLIVTHHYGGRSAPAQDPVSGTVTLVGRCWYLDGDLVAWPQDARWTDSRHTAVDVDGVVVHSGDDLRARFSESLRKVPPASSAQVLQLPHEAPCSPDGPSDIVATTRVTSGGH